MCLWKENTLSETSICNPGVHFYPHPPLHNILFGGAHLVLGTVIIWIRSHSTASCTEWNKQQDIGFQPIWNPWGIITKGSVEGHVVIQAERFSLPTGRWGDIGGV